MSSLRIATQTFILLVSLKSFGQNESSISLVQLTEHEYYKLRQDQLVSLSPKLLAKGNWSENDLKKFAKRLTYEDYLNLLDELKKDIKKIGFKNVNIISTHEQINSISSIVHSFFGVVYKGGGIGLFINLNLYSGSNAVITEASWGKIKKELKGLLKAEEEYR